jgi:osmoprotectant transport system ATP-binding protein
MLEVVGVSKSFKGATALRNVDAVFPDAATTALIGPSGCGKSTLLRLLIGLIKPDEGRVLVGGEDLATTDLRAVRRRLGYAIQSGGLFPHLTARRNVALPAVRAGRDRAWIDARLEELADLVRLPASALARFPAELSGGQRQRVALMRALALDPEALLLDEPLGALDPLIRSDLQRELRDLFARLNKTVVLVTHDLAEAAYLAPDDLLLLKDGAVAQRGAFRDLRERPASDWVSRFIEAQFKRVEPLLAGGAS